MKKSVTKYLALFAIIIATILACQKDNEPVLETSSSVEVKSSTVDSGQLEEGLREYKGRMVRANFVGRILNESDQPIAGAVVTLGGQQETTDANGIVTFIDATVYENFAYAHVSSFGYTNGSRVMIPDLEENNQNSFTIKLFSLENSQTISSEGGEVSVETDFGGAVMVIFDGGFVDENGNIYSGNVAVNLNYLNPLSEDTSNTMPGELYGIDANFQEVALGSYGMINVELRGSMGEKLQITNPARIFLPIHPDQIATAANQVPMWSFNEATGVWVEETIAYRNGNYYETQVNHFSFWNCDAPFPVVNFNATVIDAGTSNPLAGVIVTITYNGFSRSGTTDVNGYVSGKIPSGQTMTLTITDLCGTVLYTNPSFGPFTGATSITIPVTLSTAPISVSGTMIDCSSAPVTNGYVTYASSAGQFFGTSLVTAGTHSYTGVSCSIPVNVDVNGIDNNSGQAVPGITVTANPNAIANLVACGGLPTEYIRYSVNGGPLQYEILNPGGGIQTPNRIYLYASSPTGQTYIFGNAIALGTYPFDFSTSTISPALAMEGFGDVNGINPMATVGIPGAMQFTITNVGPVGTYIDIDFVGNYIDQSGTTRTVQGQAHIIRDF